jgi:hypothetical protein
MAFVITLQNLFSYMQLAEVFAVNASEQAIRPDVNRRREIRERCSEEAESLVRNET